MNKPQGLDRFQKAIPAKFAGKVCTFCDAPIQVGVDYAVLDNGDWLNVCLFHAGNVVEQCKARVVQIQNESKGLDQAQTAAVDAHCPEFLADVLVGQASQSYTLQAAAALDSAVRVIRMFKAQSAPAVAAPIVTNMFAAKCADCGKTVAEHAGRRTGTKGAWIVRHLEGQCPVVEAPVPVADGLDLSPLKAYTSNGICRFGVPDGSDSRLKVAVKFKKDGTIYVDDCAVYGHQQNYGVQHPGLAYKGKVEDALRAILADPKGGVIRYAQLTDRCGVCNTHIEHEDSIERGMGPVCAAKFG